MMPKDIRAGVRHRLFNPLLRLEDSLDMWIPSVRTDEGKHTEFTVCLSLYITFMHSRRAVFVRQLFPEDQNERQKTASARRLAAI